MPQFSVSAFGRRTAFAVGAYFMSCVCLPPDPLKAATLTWTGGGADDNWTTVGNWGPGISIAAGDFLQFSGSTRLGPVNNLAANSNIIGMTFSGTAGAFVLSGNAINLGGDVTTSSSTTLQTINLSMRMTNTRQFVVANGGLLVGGVITQSSGAQTLSKTGPGTMTLTAANTWGGQTSLLQGAIVLSGVSGAIGDGTGIQVTGGGTLRLENTETVNNTARLFDADAVNLNGGNFDFSHTGGAANYSETVGALNITGGINTVKTSQTAGGQTSVMTFASISRTAGVLNFSGIGLGESHQNRIAFTTPSNNNGIVGGYATVGNEFAGWDTGINSVRAMQLSDYVTTDQNTWAAASNVKLSTSPSILTADRQINSLNLAPSTVLDIDAGGQTLRVESGGLLVSGSSATSIQHGVLTAGEGNGVAGELIVHQNSSAALTLGAKLTNNGAGVVSLTKAGTGTLVLAEAAGFTGSTSVLNGALKLNASNGLAATGGLVMGDTSGTAATVDMRNTGQTIASLTVRSQTATSNVLTVSPAETLTINGGITLGADVFDSKTSVLIQGGGHLVVNNTGGTVQLGQATLNANVGSVTLDLSGLASATFNMGTTGSVIRVGDQNSTSSSLGTSTLKLAATTTITVNRISLGGETGQGVAQTLTLGSQSTVINTDTLNAGSVGAGSRGLGVINFATTTGTFKLRAADGTSAVPTMTVGASVLGTTSGTLGGTVTLTGHSVDLLVNNLTIGSRTTGSGPVIAAMSMDQGTLTATTVNVGHKVGTNTHALATSTGTLNIAGGIVSMTSLDLGRNNTSSGSITGTLNLSGTQSTTIGALTMGSATTVGGSVVAAVNLTGGTLNLNGALLRGGGAGTSTATLTINGGTLDMNGNAIGSGTNAVTLVAQQGVMRDLGTINGTAGLTKTTAGTLELQGANAYTGPTVINAGILRVGSLEDGGSPSTIGSSTSDAANLVLNGGNFQYTGAAGSTDRLFSVGTTAGSTLEASGTGAIAFTNTGSMGFNAQTGARTLTLTGTNSGDNTLAADIGDNTGATSLVKSGTGTWVLTGTGGYTGTTTVNAGTLRLDFSGTGAPASNIAGSASGLVMAGGTLDLKGVAAGTPAQAFASLAVSAGASTISSTLNGATSMTVTFGGASISRTAGGTLNFIPSATDSFTFTNNVNNAAGILGGYAVVNGTDWATRDGSGNVVPLSAYTALPTTGGSNTTNYSVAASLSLTGPLTINSLKISGTGTLAGGASAITFTGTSGGLIYAPAGSSDTFGITGSAVVGSGTTSELIVHVNQGSLSVANPVVSSTATAGSLTKSGNGTLVLTGTSAFIGMTLVNAGTLEISGTGTLSSSSGNISIANGATLRVNSSNAAQAIASGTDVAINGTLEVRASETVGGISGTGTVSNGGAVNAVLSANSGNETSTFAGVIQDGGAGTLGLTKTGTATLTLSGAASNTYTGPTLVNDGTLTLAKTSGNAIGGNVTVGSGSGSIADILLLAGSEQIANTGVVTISGNTTASGAGIFRMAGNAETIGGLASTGSNQGSAIVENALASTNGRLTISNAADHDFAGVIQNGAGTNSVLSLTKTGSGQQTFSGTTANTFTGTATVLAGTLRLNKTAGVNAIAGSLSIGDGSAAAFVLLGASHQIADASVLTFAGIGATAGTLQLAGNAETVGGLSSSGVNGGVIENESSVANTGTLTVNVAASTVQTFTGLLRDGDGVGTDGALALVKSGAGTQVLTGENVFTGGTTINAGTLQVGAGSATGSLGTGDIVNNDTLVINRTGTLTLDQAISGTGSVVLGGSGTVALTHDANSWSGATTVDQGTLKVGHDGLGKTGTGAVAINTGGTLYGTGTVQGSTFSLSSGAALHVGNTAAQDSYGTLTIAPVVGSGFVDLKPGSTVFLGLDPTGVADLLDIIGTGSTSVTFNASLKIGPDAFTPLVAQVFDLLDWTGLMAGMPLFGSQFSTNLMRDGSGDNGSTWDLPDVSGTGFEWDLSNFTTDGTVALVAVPEPSRALLMMLGLLAMLLTRRRR